MSTGMSTGDRILRLWSRIHRQSIVLKTSDRSRYIKMLLTFGEEN